MWAASALYLLAAIRYWQLYRRRPAVMLISLITAFVLLAETTVAATYGRNWELSWWEWHVLLITGYAFVAYSAVIQWTREGSATSLFGAISLNETLRDIQQTYGAALEEVVTAIEADEAVEPAARAARAALRAERAPGRRAGAFGPRARRTRHDPSPGRNRRDRTRSEPHPVGGGAPRSRAPIAARTFGNDRVTIALVADGRMCRAIRRPRSRCRSW